MCIRDRHNCTPTHRQCSKYITHTHAHTHTQTDTTETTVIPHSYAMYGYAVTPESVTPHGYADYATVTPNSVTHMVTLHTKLRHSASLRHPASLLAPLTRHSTTSLPTVTHRHSPSLPRHSTASLLASLHASLPRHSSRHPSRQFTMRTIRFSSG